jgi:hypothetical protein
MPVGSECKAPFLEHVVNKFGCFDDLYLFYSEGIEALVNDRVVARDTKVLIDSSHPLRVLFNTNDAIKYDWVERYTKQRKLNFIGMFGDAGKWIGNLEYSTARSLVYINGAFLKSQTPELANHIKSRLPNAIIIMVVIDPYKSHAKRNPRCGFFKYGTCFNDFINNFGRICQHRSYFVQYGTNRYLAFIV